MPRLSALISMTMVLISGLVAADTNAKAPKLKQPNVLLITVDTLRGDALGWIGGRNETPAIDALAKSGARFSTAVTPVPITLPAHTSILTGLYPARHGVRDNGQTVPVTFPTLAESLSTDGYQTAAFVSGFPLLRIFGLDRGFEHYDDTMNQGSEGWVERTAVDTATAALAWIETTPSPWFAWIHFYDPHDPYEPPRSFWQQGSQGAYHGEVAFTDFAIETLLDGISPAARANLLTVFTSDHGESLGEHQEKTHGFFIYDSTVKVPLVFHFPGRIPALESDLQPRLVDLTPTILDLLDLPAIQGIDGLSLAPILAGRALDIPPAITETYLPWIFFGWAPLTGIRTNGWKLVDAPRPELYDLKTDPNELNNIIATHPERARTMAAALEPFKVNHLERLGNDLDSETIEALRALGYIGAGEDTPTPPRGALADPKDRIDLRNRLQDAEAALRSGKFDDAIAEFQEVLGVEPNNRFAALRIGIAHLKAGRADQAVPRLQYSVELDPERAEARYALADALMRLERFGEAASQWREVARLQPRRAEAWFNLGLASARSGSEASAREALDHAMSIDDTGEIRGKIEADPQLKKLIEPIGTKKNRVPR